MSSFPLTPVSIDKLTELCQGRGIQFLEPRKSYILLCCRYCAPENISMNDDLGLKENNS